jgi:hypothetical protein
LSCVQKEALPIGYVRVGCAHGRKKTPAGTPTATSSRRSLVLKHHITPRPPNDETTSPSTQVKMSFGFSVGDFVAVGQLTIQLWRAFKDAPQEFAEITRELCSINIVITDLSDQAASPTSLLNRRGKNRKEEILTLSKNLQSILEELSDIHRKYQYMGYNAWKRVRLGERDLTALRTKLVLHLNLLNGFTTSLAMASIERMEPLMVEIYKHLRNSARGSNLGARGILDAQSSIGLASGENDGWELVEEELERELDIPRLYVQEHRDEIQTICKSMFIFRGFDSS